MTTTSNEAHGGLRHHEDKVLEHCRRKVTKRLKAELDVLASEGVTPRRFLTFIGDEPLGSNAIDAWEDIELATRPSDVDNGSDHDERRAIKADAAAWIGELEAAETDVF